MISKVLGHITTIHKMNCPYEGCYGEIQITSYLSKRFVTTMRIHPCPVCKRFELTSKTLLQEVEKL